MNLSNLTSKQLRRAAQLKEQIDRIRGELGRLLGGQPGKGSKKKLHMSAAAKAKIAAAQRARWAKVKAKEK